MGASQSTPTERRKRSPPDDVERRAEREGLVDSENDVTDADDVVSDDDPQYQQPFSPRAVNRFGSGTSPDSDAALHTDISAVQLTSAPVTPTVSSELDSRFHIVILMSDTGGGHRASAQALESAFDLLYPGRIRVTIVDFWASVAGWPFQNFPAQYTFLAKRPILWKGIYLWAAFPPTRALTELAFSLFCHRKVRHYFEDIEPDLILSVHPLVNTLSLSVLESMRQRQSYPTPPYATVVTDLGDAHPTWFDPRANHIYVPSEPLQNAAVERGMRPENVRLFGLPIRPAFWQPSPDRNQLRAKLGMAQHIPTVLLVGGGDGVGGLRAIAEAIAAKIAEEAGAAAGQLVVVCGKNKSLLASMRARSWPVPVILKGFVNNMSDWMSACDILCSKAGPGTIAEAWIRGLPIIITGFLPGQEEGNVRLVTESGSGEFHTDPDAIAKCAACWVVDPELRAAIAGRALELARPTSTREIATDIWQLGQQCLAEREAFQRRLQSAAPAERARPNGYIAMGKYYIRSAVRSVQRGFASLFGGPEMQHDRPRE